MSVPRHPCRSISVLTCRVSPRGSDARGAAHTRRASCVVLRFALPPTAIATAAPDGNQSADNQEPDDSGADPHENVRHHSTPLFPFCRFHFGTSSAVPSLTAARIGARAVNAHGRGLRRLATRACAAVFSTAALVGVPQAATRQGRGKRSPNQRNLHHLLDVLVHSAPPLF